jgi:ATP-binding cassette subfamily B protein
MKGIRRVLGYLRHYWGTALIAFISLLIVNAANLSTPQLLKILIDQGIMQKNMTQIWWISGGLVAIALGRGLFNFLYGYLMEITSQGVAFELRNKIFEKLQKLSFSYHDQSQTGKLMTRMTSDVEMVRNFAGQGLLQMISAVILLVGTLIILFSMNWLLTLIFFAMLPFILLVFGIFIRQVMPFSRIIQEKLGNLNSILQENLAGIRVVKAFAREPFEMERFQKRNAELYDVNLTFINLFATFFPLVFMIANIGVAVVVWVGGVQVIGNQMSLGSLVAFIGYQGFFLMPVFMLGFIGSSLSRAEASAIRIFEVIDAKSDIEDKPGAAELRC